MVGEEMKVAIICLLLAAFAAAKRSPIEPVDRMRVTPPPPVRVNKLELSLVTREIDLNSHLAKIKSTIVLENKGESSVSEFLYTVDGDHKDKVAFIGASLQLEKDASNTMPLMIQSASPISDRPHLGVYTIIMPALPVGDKCTVVVELVLAQVVLPYPQEVSQNDQQLVQFLGNAYLISPYPSKSQTTTVKLPSSTIESFSRVSPTSSSDNELTYGPYADVAPYSTGKMNVHFENNGPFIVVAELERLIEVSHWGNIAVEEKIHIKHTGAVLKGSFSRYDYQRNPNSGPSSVKDYKTILPAAARDVYYRDEIGNISTSHLREDEEFVELELRPRFPLFGGWQTKYYFGYNLPSYEYLYHSGNKYQLSMRFVDHVFDDQLIEKVTVRVVLPEGAKDIYLRTSYPVEELPRELHFTYLDTVGRPVVVATSNNLVEQHIQDFIVEYSFDRIMLMQEPMLIVLALFVFFLFVIVAVRLDFSITKDSALLAKQQASVVMDSILSAHDRRAALVPNYQTAITSFKSSKDTKSFKTTKRGLDDKYKAYTDQITSLIKQQLQAADPDRAAKVNELQKKMSEVKNALDESCLLAEKVVAEKIGKQQYVDQSKSCQSRIDRLTSEVDAVIQTL